MKIIFLLVIILSTLLLQCRPKEEDFYLSAIQNSILPEIDLILIPNRYNYLDEEWIIERKPSHFTKEKILHELNRYSRTWKEFEKENKSNLSEENGLVIINGTGISHSTHYDYDRNIPIVFYGPKYFKSGQYQESIHQQHIVPTVSQLLQSPVPKGSLEKPLKNILVNQTTKSNSSYTAEDNNFQRPEIILFIVIDQGGMELYNSHKNSYAHIKKLFQEGSYFPSSTVGHIDAHTAVGHVAIGTGGYPLQHHIIGNDRIFPTSDGKVIKHAVYENFSNSLDLKQMESDSLADVWDLYRKNKPVIISQCYAARASIGMAGHGADFNNESYVLEEKSNLLPDKDFVYWLTKKDLNWVTSDEQYSLPTIAKDFQIQKFNSKQPIHPYWKGIDYDSNKLDQNFYKIVGSPMESILESKFLQSVIQTEIINKNLHQDQETDLVYITFKAVDAVGHTHGWESEESRIVLEETDKQIGALFSFLKENYDDNFAIVLTADHGAGPRMEFSGGQFLSYNDVIEEVQFLLPAAVRKKENLINFYTTGQISINKNVAEKYKISIYQIQKAIEGIKVKDRKFFEKVLKRSDIFR